ncbi:hypothetical protein NPIL_91871 [Nephila pilipes]|uniref:DUF5641 domain-containing protein n=1 Tax=Nephila pilipes TaxID=299642 RepID=A0A8X6NWK4_NEPPI|nr:hypothetical protein NPIL_91871 [Nephila pilipes]
MQTEDLFGSRMMGLSRFCLEQVEFLCWTSVKTLSCQTVINGDDMKRLSWPLGRIFKALPDDGGAVQSRG